MRPVLSPWPMGVAAAFSLGLLLGFECCHRAQAQDPMHPLLVPDYGGVMSGPVLVLSDSTRSYVLTAPTEPLRWVSVDSLLAVIERGHDAEETMLCNGCAGDWGLCGLVAQGHAAERLYLRAMGRTR